MISLVILGLLALAEKVKLDPYSRGKMGARAPLQPASAYLPTRRWLRQQQFLDSRSGRIDALDLYLSEVRARWSDVQDNEVLHQGVVSWTTQAERDMWLSDVVPLSGIPTKGADDLLYRLRIDATVAPGLTARTLVERPAATSLPAAVTASKDATVKALCALRVLDNVAIRLLAALSAADKTNSTLAEALTLYRGEGNLATPPSNQSLIASVPAETSLGFRTQETDATYKGEPSLVNPTVRADLSNMAWLAAAEAPNLSGRSDDFVKEYAAAFGFLIHLIGGDVPASRFREGYPDMDDARRRLARWSAGIWAEAALEDSTEAKALERWESILAELQVVRSDGLDGGAEDAVIVAPTDPVKLVAGILSEGLAFMRTKTRKQSLTGQPGNVSLGLAYLRYKAAASEGSFADTLLSAIKAARAKLPPEHDLVQAIKQDAGADRPLELLMAGNIHASEYGPVSREWLQDGLARWLAVGNNLDLVNNFVENADQHMWGPIANAYLPHRAPVWRCRRLHDYYRGVFGDYPQ